MKNYTVVVILVLALFGGQVEGQNRWIQSGQSNQATFAKSLQNILNSLGNGDTLWGGYLGGTAIDQWVEGPIDGPYVRGPLYRQFFYAGDGSSSVERAAIANGVELSEIKGLFWWQGETGHAIYTDYSVRFEQMMSWLEQDYGVMGLCAVLVEPWTEVLDYTDTIIAQIKSIVAARDSVRASVSSRGYRRTDDVHIGTAGAHAVAGEAIEKMWKLVGLEFDQTGPGSILGFGNM